MTTRLLRPIAVVVLTGVLAACGSGSTVPAALDTRNDVCRTCRMTVSNPAFAAQLVAPGEEPAFFDDIGCLVAFLRESPRPNGAAAFVADHRTRLWIPAGTAVYTRVPALATPMGSHLVAHASAASRDEDPGVRGGSAVTLADLFGPAGPPGGESRR